MHRFFCWLYHFARRVYLVIRHRWTEYNHRASVAWSSQMGVTQVKRNPELIVSLTTIPERIGTVALCLDSLLRQTLKPDRLILWLSESNEDGRPVINLGTLPADILRLIPRGLEIRWCKDIRSYRKIVPTLHAHPTAIIVTADDDIFYPRQWLKALYDAYQTEPQYVHCHRAHLIKYDPAGFVMPYRQWEMLAQGYKGPSLNLFPTGSGGVLYAPNHLHPDVINEDAFLSMCPKADDVWLKAMSVIVNTPCKKVSETTLTLLEVRIPNNRSLFSENVTLNGNDPQIKAVAKHYGIYSEMTMK